MEKSPHQPTETSLSMAASSPGLTPRMSNKHNKKEAMKPEKGRLAADPSARGIGRGSLQYNIGDFESDDDGISVVDGMSFSFASDTWVSEEERVSVTQEGPPDETSTDSWDDEDGIPVVDGASYSYEAVWRAFPELFKGASPRRHYDIPHNGHQHTPVPMAVNRSDESYSAEESAGEEDHVTLTKRIVSRMEALKNVWSGDNRDQFLSPISEKQSRGEQSADRREEDSGHFSVSLHESVDDNSTVSSSAAAPSVAGESFDTLSTSSYREYGGFAAPQPPLSSFDSDYHSLAADRAMNKWLKAANTGAMVPYGAVPVKKGKKESVVQTVDDTEKLSLDESSDNNSNPNSRASTASGSPYRAKTYEFRPEDSSRRRKRVLWACLVAGLLMLIGIILGVALWRASDSSPSSAGVITPPEPQSNDSNNTTEMTLAPSMPSEGEVLLTLSLSFEQPVQDWEAVAVVLVTELAGELSKLEGFLEIELSLGHPHSERRRRTLRNLQTSNLVLVGSVIFEMTPASEVESEVFIIVCKLLADVNHVQQSLSQKPSLSGITYNGPAADDDCADFVTTQPDDTPSPTLAPTLHAATRPDRGPNSSGALPIPADHETPRPSAAPVVQVEPIPDTPSPTIEQSGMPSLGPSLEPSLEPSLGPSMEPSGFFSEQPSMQPSLVPSFTRMPTMETEAPIMTVTPTSTEPTSMPTLAPTSVPTLIQPDPPSPSASPTSSPTYQPSAGPPSSSPAIWGRAPTDPQTPVPTVSLTETPSEGPSTALTFLPTSVPSGEKTHDLGAPKPATIASNATVSFP